MTKSLLKVSNLVKEFGKHTIVNNVSFELQENETLALLGSNGAGKTTIMHMLLTILKPTSGQILYFDKDLSNFRSEILQHVSFASTYVKLPPRLTVWENLDIYARLYGITKNDRNSNIEKYLKFFGMWNLKDSSCGVLSAGQITRVMLAKAFMTNPKIVLLDEPTASLDPDIAYEVRSFILEQQKEKGTSILVTSHNMEEVTDICDRVLVLKYGKIIAQGTPESLAATISACKVNLMVADAEMLINYLILNNIKYTQDKNSISLEINESEIAPLLHDLAQKNIQYVNISIDKPTLKDYFLSLSK